MAQGDFFRLSMDGREETLLYLLIASVACLLSITNHYSVALTTEYGIHATSFGRTTSSSNR